MRHDRECYTYLIGWTRLGLFYYGSRTAIGCSPEDLWVRYFTSSEIVKKVRNTHGDPDLIQVRQGFGDDRLACITWENKVLKRLGAVTRDDFLNRANAFGVTGDPMAGELNPMFGRERPDSAERMRHSNPMHDPEVVKRASASLRGRKTWNKGIPNEAARERMRMRNPMKDPAALQKRLSKRTPEMSGKGQVWVANVVTGERKRVAPASLANLLAGGEWIKLSNRKPIPLELGL